MAAHQAVLPTAKVALANPEERELAELDATALADGGSNVNLLTEEAASKISLRLRASSRVLSGLQGGEARAQSGRVLLRSKKSDFALTIDVLVVHTIAAKAAGVSFQPDKWLSPERGRMLADTYPKPPFNIDLLLGQECLWACLLYTSPSPRDATLSRMPSSA